MSEQSKRLATRFEHSKDKQQTNDATTVQREQVLDRAFASMRVDLKEHLENSVRN
jgi:hypothetical protein